MLQKFRTIRYTLCCIFSWCTILSQNFKKCNILWLNKQTYMFMCYNLPTKFQDCLNNAVNNQLSTHFDLKKLYFDYAVTERLG